MRPPIPSDASPCPCGSGAVFASCCAPYLRGHAAPATAEALMRSRYSAYVCRDSAYVLATWHPAQRPRHLDLRGDATDWLSLQIVEVVTGGPHDDDGVVEFIARFRHGSGVQTLRERSRFARIDGAWLYVDGAVGHEPPEAASTVRPAVRTAGPGRNDPCPCGSGQKYKRCCGR